VKVTSRISKSVTKDALRGDLHETPAGYRMHTALLHPVKEFSEGWARSYIVAADADAWDALAVWCRRESRVGPGATVTERNRGARLITTADRIDRNLLRLSGHPAYRGIAVAGTDSTVIPAVRAHRDGAWFPTVRMAVRAGGYDELALEHTELVPEVFKSKGRVFTRWSAAHPEPA